MSEARCRAGPCRWAKCIAPLWVLLCAQAVWGDGQRGAAHWHCDPEYGLIQQVTCTFDLGSASARSLESLGLRSLTERACDPFPANVPGPGVDGLANLPPATGSRPVVIPDGPEQRTFTYTAHSETREECFQGVAALRQSNGTYRLVLSNVFGVLFDGGALPEAKRAGARLGGAWHLPLVFANQPGDFPQSFVRLVNLSDGGNRLRIRAYDEDGYMATDTVLLEPLAALHFNSTDLEDGNSDKDIEPFGHRGSHWRLAIEPADQGAENQAFLAGAYARTIGEGDNTFLTSLHGYAEPISNGNDAAYPYLHVLPVFNPGRNDTRASHLRLTNLADRARRYIVAAVDGAGAVRAREIGPIPPQATRQWSAEALEAGPDGLGEGVGKWLLIVGGDPALAVHLLQSRFGSTAGQWTNLTALEPTAPYYSDAQIIRIFRRAQLLLEGS